MGVLEDGRCDRCFVPNGDVAHLCRPVNELAPEPEEPPLDPERLRVAAAAVCEMLGHFSHIGRSSGCDGVEHARAALEAADRYDRLQAAERQARRPV